MFPIFDLIPTSTKKLIFNIWKKSFKKICHFHKCTPDEIIFKLTDNPNDWCDYLTFITHTKIMKRDLELPSINTTNFMNEISKPEILEGDLLHYIPDNLEKIFSMFHLTCKEHRKHINHIHFIEHAGINNDDIVKLLDKRKKRDE